MRGRLIIPFLAELAQLDTDATRQAGGYDDIWRTELPGGRREKALIRIPCQVEVSAHNQQTQGPSGNLPNARFMLVFHFKDLERLALVDTVTGDALIRVNDRLNAIFDKSGALTQSFPNPPGLYCTEAQPREYGLGSKRNLFLTTWDDRPQGRPNT
jgi:hypothetical protein